MVSFEEARSTREDCLIRSFQSDMEANICVEGELLEEAGELYGTSAIQSVHFPTDGALGCQGGGA